MRVWSPVCRGEDLRKMDCPLKCKKYIKCSAVEITLVKTTLYLDSYNSRFVNLFSDITHTSVKGDIEM